MRLVVRQGVVLALIGAAVGALAALAATRVLKSLLYSVSTTDPIAFAGVLVMLCVIALLASYVPARRAARARADGRAARRVIFGSVSARPGAIMQSPMRSSDTDHHYRIVESPVGTLRLVANEDSLVEVSWEEKNAQRESLQLRAEPGQHAVLDETARQLEEYFAGRRRTFELKLHFEGTEFQRKVWNALLTIPFGETR